VKEGKVSSVFLNSQIRRFVIFFYKEVFIIDIYTDGSYNKVTNISSGAFVVVENDEIIKDSSFVVFNDGRNNVKGELEAVVRAILYCKKHGIKEINLYFDYVGIEKWLNGEWKVKDTFVYNFIKYVKESGVKINFKKVKGHSGNKYHDLADMSCSDLTSIQGEKTK
jgi:ribonuclease HI